MTRAAHPHPVQPSPPDLTYNGVMGVGQPVLSCLDARGPIAVEGAGASRRPAASIRDLGSDLERPKRLGPGGESGARSQGGASRCQWELNHSRDAHGGRTFESHTDEGAATMPKYLLEVNYTLDGVKGVVAKGGSAQGRGTGGREERWRQTGCLLLRVRRDRRLHHRRPA